MKETKVGLKKCLLFITLMICVGALMGAATQIDLTANVRGILGSANGGTGSAFFGISGPTALRTYTLPDASKTLMATDTAVTAAQLPNPSASTLGGVESITCSAGQHVTQISTSGVPTCSADTGAALNQAAPTGTINGSNVTFTLGSTPTAAADVNCYENGLQQQQGAGNDYTISSATITYLTAPPTGTKLICTWY